jgi:hypothetical protein
MPDLSAGSNFVAEACSRISLVFKYNRERWIESWTAGLVLVARRAHAATSPTPVYVCMQPIHAVALAVCISVYLPCST